MMGIYLLQARLRQVNLKGFEVKIHIEHISITLLAIPMIYRPGAITNAMVLMEDAYYA